MSEMAAQRLVLCLRPCAWTQHGRLHRSIPSSLSVLAASLGCAFLGLFAFFVPCMIFVGGSQGLDLLTLFDRKMGIPQGLGDCRSLGCDTS